MAPAKSPVQAPPKSDAYTGMLVVSLLILIMGCVFLYLDWSQYSSNKAPQVPAALPRPGTGGPAPAPGPGGPAPAPMGQMGGAGGGNP
jgi:hypothetical protein